MDEFKSKLKTFVKPKKHKHFNRGSKIGNSILTQLRVGRSHLNVHKFALGLSDTEKCLCDRPETVSHYLTQCFLYNEECHILYSKVSQIIPNFTLLPDKLKMKVLLEGTNLQSED